MAGAAEAGQRAKIVATLGPATDRPELVEALLLAGADVLRLNFSHGTADDHVRRIGWVRAAAARLGRAAALLQDLQGPKVRTGRLVGGRPVRLVEGAEVTITTEPVAGTADRLGTDYPGLPSDVRPGDRLLLADGRIVLRALATGSTEVRCRVERGGPLGERQGISLPGVPIALPALTAKDEADLELGLAHGVDYVALSFVRRAEDLERARAFMRARGGAAPLIAKIETAEAVDRLDEVLAASDGVMIARGDLGVQVGPERVPGLQKLIVRGAKARGHPAIVATQMLETMIEQPEPTRAEASDVANAVWDGADALMLSGETAVGKHPAAAVEAMARIVAAAEETARRVGAAVGPTARPTGGAATARARAISHAARVLAEELPARAIVGLTRTGRTAQLLSAERPPVPIFAFTPDERVRRRLALWWGVVPVGCEVADQVEAMVERIARRSVEASLAAPGDLLVVVGAMPLRAGVHTNFVKLHRVGGGPELRRRAAGRGGRSGPRRG
jgi:pyruvate kinase